MMYGVHLRAVLAISNKELKAIIDFYLQLRNLPAIANWGTSVLIFADCV
jgi:hypothetical protein